MNLFSENSSPEYPELNKGVCVAVLLACWAVYALKGLMHDFYFYSTDLIFLFYRRIWLGVTCATHAPRRWTVADDASIMSARRAVRRGAIGSYSAQRRLALGARRHALVDDARRQRHFRRPRLFGLCAACSGD